MKKFTLIFNIVLALAVVALFVLHFTSKSGKSTVASNGKTETTTELSANFTAAWVNVDTVLNSYDMYFDMRKELEVNSRKLEAELNAKSRTFEKEAMDFQDKVQKGLVTRSEAQQLQTTLANKEQELYRLRDEMRMQLAEEEQVKLRKIQNSITEFLKEYNEDKGYHIILSSTFGGPMLYGHPALDITNDVVKGLNAKYSVNRPKENK
ncbi:MAG TPA: OmpH family outer membrane protein [Tenuifilaceae bacterium]|nr:OmpH family outer membrane protein [Tenuifilaceae bacterium]